MPPIEIPYSPRRAANEKRYGMARTDVQQCLLCLKPVNPDTCRYVVLTSDLGMIADPDIESTNEPNGGGFYIGSECWRKNPQLWDYRVRI
jgi:hypothetical protein